MWAFSISEGENLVAEHGIRHAPDAMDLKSHPLYMLWELSRKPFLAGGA